MGMRRGSFSTFDYPPGYCSWGKINQEAWEQKKRDITKPRSEKLSRTKIGTNK